MSCVVFVGLESVCTAVVPPASTNGRCLCCSSQTKCCLPAVFSVVPFSLVSVLPFLVLFAGFVHVTLGSSRFSAFGIFVVFVEGFGSLFIRILSSVVL